MMDRETCHVTRRDLVSTIQTLGNYKNMTNFSLTQILKEQMQTDE